MPYVIEVEELFDAPAKWLCLLGINEQCNEDQPRSAHASWRFVRQHYLQVLETTTLAQIAGKRTRSARAGGRQP